MLSRNRTFLVALLGLIALAWIAKLVWNATFPYRSARLAAKIKTLSDQGETTEAVDLLEKSLARLSLADEYSCKVRMILDGWFQGPSREQILSDAKSRGLPDDSLLTWRMEFALAEAFSAPFGGYFWTSNSNLKNLAQEALHQRPDDSLTSMILAMTHFQFREFSQCRKLVDPALSRWPESFRLRLLKGRCLVAQGKHDSALSTFPDPEKVFQESNVLTSSGYRARLVTRFDLMEDWYRAALVGAHGVSAQQFSWDVTACKTYGGRDWKSQARAACRIQKRLHPSDTATPCLEKSIDREDHVRMQELSKVFGGPPKCPEWANPTPARRSEEPLDTPMTNPPTTQEQTDCLFGTGDSTKDTKCPE
ncbi:MAG: hypothetical protein IPO40_09235 [Fibrobacteres bacterium]|nr:hypothetical protein [Fibrobacterota bacterium]